MVPPHLPPGYKENPLERDIEKAVKAYARKKGWWVRKFSTENSRSEPDDIFARDFGPFSYVFFIEFKRHGRKPTPTQRDKHEKIRNETGLRVYVIDSVDNGKYLLDDLEERIEGLMPKVRHG